MTRRPIHEPFYRSSLLLRLLANRAQPPLAGAVVQDTGGNWVGRVRQLRRQRLKAGPLPRLSPDVMGRALRMYRENLTSIARLCRGRKQRLIMMTQPVLWRKDLPRDIEFLLTAHTETGAYPAEVLAEAMEAFNRTMIEVCSREGIEYVDLASMLPHDTTVFYDDCHFNISGCRKVARILCDHIVQRGGHRRCEPPRGENCARSQ